jgi:hypothetical protein
MENGDVREEISPTSFYPGTTDLNGASLLAVHPGDNMQRMDIHLAAALPARRVRGRIIDGRNSQPVAGALIRALLRNPNPNVTVPSAVANQSGNFEISGLTAGAYFLFANLPTTGAGGTAGGATGRAAIDVEGEDLQNVTIVIPPAFDLRGRFVLEGQASIDVTNLLINIRRDPDLFGAPTIQMLRRALDADPNSTQPDGTFTIAGIGTGDYRIGVSALGIPSNGGWINLRQGTYLKAIRFGTTDVLKDGLHLDAAPQSQLEVLLGTTEGDIAGSVVDAKNEAFPNSRVALVPEPSLRYRVDLYRVAASDSKGHFEIGRIAPGDYKLFALDGIQNGAWLDPDFLKDFDAKGTAVHITEVSKENAQLTVIDVGR